MLFTYSSTEVNHSKSSSEISRKLMFSSSHFL
nr:MAG TPA: hypothetical protein [Caudoviricetes sp.]DAW75831.1 MAG TPA: hypothetical protein [Crassvirales sp.]